MLKSILILPVFFLFFNSNAQYINRFEKEFRVFAEKDIINPVSKNGTILFTGSSSIRYWKNPQADFNNNKIINRGFGGSEIDDLIENFDEIILKYNPKTIVIYSGDNDIAAGKSPEKVFGDFCVLYGMIKNSLPKSKVVFIAIKPSIARWNISLEMVKANTMINEYLNTVANGDFVDVYSIMIGMDGLPTKDLFLEDGLHMTDKGYQLWTKAVAPYIE